jgi:hypothetical protein
MQAHDDVRGLPRDILQDVKRAQYERKVAEMAAITRAERSRSVGNTPRPTPAKAQYEGSSDVVA